MVLFAAVGLFCTCDTACRYSLNRYMYMHIASGMMSVHGLHNNWAYKCLSLGHKK